MKYLSIPAVIVFFFTTSAGAQTAIDGEDLVMRSSGNDSGNDWVLDENGYVGTYITLASPGQVTIEVEASGAQTPHMNIVLNDTKAGFDVSSGFNTYQHTFDLPAGTHFLRTEFNNDIPAASRELTIRELTVTGATVSNVNTNTNALNAADTYIDNYRKGNANVTLVGVSPGTPVDIKLKNHAFNFGANIHGTSSSILSNSQYTQFFTDHFNAMVPSREGKWNNQEAGSSQPGTPTLNTLDAFLDFAEDNDLRARMHNLIWGNTVSSQEQPQWVVDLLNTSGSGAALTSAITNRIDYYVGDGDGDTNDGDLSQRYYELDIYNESWHTGENTFGSNNYWDRLSPSGIAGVYEDASQAIAAAGSNAKVFVNEYNVFQGGPDTYANWYRQHVEAIENADGEPFDQTVEGIGIQYYVVDGHSASGMQQVLQNLSVLGLPIALTEFGVQGSVSTSQAPQIVEEAIRMMFGNPETTSFMYWGFWNGATSSLQSSSILANTNWTLTPTGVMYESLMDEWDTDLSLLAGPGGILNFDGFYGDYEVTVGGQTYDLNLTKGVNDYQLIIAVPGDADGDGDVDLDDYNIMSGNMYTNVAGGADDGDFDDDGDVDFEDFVIQALNFGDWPDAEETLGALPGAGVPEPAMLTLVTMGVLSITRRRRRCR